MSRTKGRTHRPSAGLEVLTQRLRRMNVELDELLTRGVPDELTTSERVEAAFICSRAIAHLDHWLAALEDRRAATRRRPRRSPDGGSARRFDPYRNFKFRIFWAGSKTPVAGVSKMSSLKRTTASVKRRRSSSGASRELTGRTKFEPITLEHGVTHDREFERWASQVWNSGSSRGTGDALKNSRRNVVIEVLNEAGQPAFRYKVYRCWVSEFQALPELDANANAVAIQHLKVENEGWERVEVDRS